MKAKFLLSKHAMRRYHSRIGPATKKEMLKSLEESVLVEYHKGYQIFVNGDQHVMWITQEYVTKYGQARVLAKTCYPTDWSGWD